MFCGKMTNRKVNNVHKCALRVSLNDYASSFEELLQIKEEVTIHERNLQKAYARGIETNHFHLGGA